MMPNRRRLAALLLAPVLVMTAGLIHYLPDQPLSGSAALAEPGIGADTGPGRLYQGEGGSLSEQGLTWPKRSDPEQIPQGDVGVDENDADPIGPGPRLTILLVLGLVLFSIGFYSVRSSNPVRD